MKFIFQRRLVARAHPRSKSWFVGFRRVSWSGTIWAKALTTSSAVCNFLWAIHPAPDPSSVKGGFINLCGFSCCSTCDFRDISPLDIQLGHFSTSIPALLSYPSFNFQFLGVFQRDGLLVLPNFLFLTPPRQKTLVHHPHRHSTPAQHFTMILTSAPRCD